MKKYHFFITASLISFNFVSANAQTINNQNSQDNISKRESSKNENNLSDDLKPLDKVDLSTPTSNLDSIEDKKNIETSEVISSESNEKNAENDKTSEKEVVATIDRTNIPDIDPLTLNPKNAKIREIFDITFNYNYLINGMALVFDDDHILIEKKYLVPILNDFENPVFHTINKKEYFYIPAKFVKNIDLEQLKVGVSLAPEFFKPQSIKLDKAVEIPADPISAFYVNYNLSADLKNYADFIGGFSTGFMHKNNWNLRSTFSMDKDKKFTRGDTNFTYEFPSKKRLILGDTSGASLNNFSSGNFLGFRLSSPYYAGSIDNKELLPTVNVQGYSLNPSKLDIYINDRLYQSQDVLAGKYNLSVPLLNEAGLGNVRAVVYDKAGNPIVVEYPFFADSTILKEGTFEYDISGGFMRKADDGFFSYDYQQPMVNALILYGVTDKWTQQLYFQATKDYQAISGTANMIPFVSLGKISASLSANNQNQTLGGLMYSKSFDKFAFGINYNRALGQEMFCTAYSYSCTKDSLQIYTGFQLPASLGSLNLTYTKNNGWSRDFETPDWYLGSNQITSLSYSKNIMGGLSLNANISKTKSSGLAGNSTNAYIGLSYSFGRGASGSTSISGSGDSKTYQQQLSINENPDKPWLGYGGITTNKNSSGGELNNNFFYAANLSKFSYNISGSQSKSTGVSTSGNIAGSIYFLPNEKKIGLSKEITSGLGLVEVQNTNGTPIPISYENKLAGYTDKNGIFVVPNISPNNLETVGVDINKMPYNVTILEHTKSFRIPSNGSAKFVFRARTNPYLVRLYGLPSGYVFKLGDDYYAVGEQGKTTLEVEGEARIEYSEGQYCDIDFKKDIKIYYCNAPGKEMTQFLDAFSKSTLKPDRKLSLMKRDFEKFMQSMGKKVTPEDEEIIKNFVYPSNNDNSSNSATQKEGEQSSNQTDSENPEVNLEDDKK